MHANDSNIEFRGEKLPKTDKNLKLRATNKFSEKIKALKKRAHSKSR